MLNNTTVALPGVHMAASDADDHAHVEVAHGFALFLAPDVEGREVNGTSGQLDDVVSRPSKRIKWGLSMGLPRWCAFDGRRSRVAPSWTREKSALVLSSLVQVPD